MLTGKMNKIINPLAIEEVACTVTNNRTSGVVVTYSKGYYQFKLNYNYQQYDRSAESMYYRDSAGNAHCLGYMSAGGWGQSPSYEIKDFVLDLSLFETPETLKNKTSFTIYFSPASRDPHFNFFYCTGIRKIGGGGGVKFSKTYGLGNLKPSYV